jgi:Zn-dependent M32 family carboxypeptidase
MLNLQREAVKFVNAAQKDINALQKNMEPVSIKVAIDTCLNRLPAILDKIDREIEAEINAKREKRLKEAKNE